MDKKDLVKINDYLWEIPKNFRADMRVPARVYADEQLLGKTFEDRSLEQLVNVATLPGIVSWSLAMSDIHEGYGFPIGGVAAMDTEDGVISPGGVGYDINCGVRVLSSDLESKEVEPYLEQLMNQIQRDVPSGVGRGGSVKLSPESMKNVLEKGVKWVVEKGYGEKEDIEHCEEEGAMVGADAAAVSERAKARGRDQLGTLGSGNHFLEVQRVEEIFDEEVAKVFGLFKDQVTIMIHSGSRGLGHQVCTDYVRVMHNALSKYQIKLPDSELACAPFNSPEGQQYFGAMTASANYAWTNRQLIMYLIRKAWQRVLGDKSGQLKLIYDVAHNIAKKEVHNGQQLCVHRKGATRAFPAGREEVPTAYRQIGQPVLIPGTMGTASYILVGTEKAVETFFSVCHGSGRVLSRHAAIRQIQGAELRRQLAEKGIVVRCLSNRGLAEEAPLAYKDIHNVVDVVVKAGLAKLVARLKPMGVVKG
jgi:tRNA-splicing ligase RtcB